VNRVNSSVADCYPKGAGFYSRVMLGIFPFRKRVLRTLVWQNNLGKEANLKLKQILSYNLQNIFFYIEHRTQRTTQLLSIHQISFKNGRNTHSCISSNIWPKLVDFWVIWANYDHSSRNWTIFWRENRSKFNCMVFTHFRTNFSQIGEIRISVLKLRMLEFRVEVSF
jgi:hypothetical protein